MSLGKQRTPKSRPPVPKSPRPRKVTMAKMLRANKKRLFRNPTTPSGR